MHLAARWIHVFAGIMWVGQTYFFTWLDGRFTEMASRSASEHQVWMVHSGGFYLVEKQNRPTLKPGRLHWFRWEAAITWLSGIVLLLLVYYMGGLMVDERMETTLPICAGIGTILLSWPVYDLLWRTRIGERTRVVLSYLLLVGVAFGLTRLMDGRAAYLHVGAMLGTLMTLNVWMRILPGQRAMVAALHAGKDADLALAERAKTRSKHNTFMAVPVVFIMVSNHFPVITYGDPANWLILAGLILVGWVTAAFLRRA